MNVSATPILELRSITKTFPGTKALDQVSLHVNAGEVLTLLGENGAGKSTLMKVLSGVWPEGTYEGEIRIRGQVQAFKDTRNAFAAGIAMIHQELSVFRELSIAEHLELDQLPVFIDWNALHARTQKFLDTLGLGLMSRTRVGDLSVGGRQLVEIARALYRNAQILVFDEPTSALTELEVVRLYGIIEKLRAEGRAIIYITHRMDEVFRLSDRMVVLRDGKNAGELDALHQGERISRKTLEPRIISQMVGRAIEDIYPPKNTKFGEEVLRAESLSFRTPRGKFRVKDFSFQLKAGEVVGLAGLLGAGRSDTFDALFGVVNPAGPRGGGYEVTGKVFVKGREVHLSDPTEAIQVRMAYVSEERKANGLVLNQSIRNNMVLPALRAGRAELTATTSLWSLIRGENEGPITEKWAREMRVKSAHLGQSVGELSGGNQQKVVLAKWLMTEPEILFLDEPTRGIDVGAKVEIYNWIQRLAAQGMAIVVASSEMPELLGLCHRILVLREGHLSAELEGANATQEDIMRAASL